MNKFFNKCDYLTHIDQTIKLRGAFRCNEIGTGKVHSTPGTGTDEDPAVRSKSAAGKGKSVKRPPSVPRIPTPSNSIGKDKNLKKQLNSSRKNTSSRQKLKSRGSLLGQGSRSRRNEVSRTVVSRTTNHPSPSLTPSLSQPGQESNPRRNEVSRTVVSRTTNHPSPSSTPPFPLSSSTNRSNKTAVETPRKPRRIKPRKLFEEKLQNYLEMDREDNRLRSMNMELLLINSLKINAFKVQTVIENFIKDKNYTCIFCLTETKVDSLDFDPKGIKIFSKHRKNTEKKGGGLIIGYKMTGIPD